MGRIVYQLRNRCIYETDNKIRKTNNDSHVMKGHRTVKRTSLNFTYHLKSGVSITAIHFTERKEEEKDVFTIYYSLLDRLGIYKRDAELIDLDWSKDELTESNSIHNNQLHKKETPFGHHSHLMIDRKWRHVFFEKILSANIPDRMVRQHSEQFEKAALYFSESLDREKLLFDDGASAEHSSHV